MRRNLIDEIGNYYNMLEGFAMVALDLSHNRINLIKPDLFVVSNTSQSF